MRIRTVTTSSGKRAVQVVSKLYGHLKVHKHIGSYANEKERLLLFQQAAVYIQEKSGQQDLFTKLHPDLADVIISPGQPLLTYRLLSTVYEKIGFGEYPHPLVKDLVIARIIQPASKRETREVMSDLFGHEYSLVTIYRYLKKALAGGLKDSFQQALIKFAKTDGDTLKLVFYDVTTLYFESAASDTLRDFGFSKDHRPSEVQIVVGLVVNRQGFPLYFDVFPGRTFEGHTILTIISNVQSILGSKNLTVVADAAMLSRINLEELDSQGIGFIVGARLGNLPRTTREKVSQAILGQDGKITSVRYHNYKLICQYLSKRAAKDRVDREKQVTAAQKAIAQPSKIARRYRFLETLGQKYALNADLVSRAKQLEGIKGYLTNTSLDSQMVIDRYHDLWQIENAFRLTKSDLEARPIFHRLGETIKAHLVIVFAGLAISRYIEINSGLSIQKILKATLKITTHQLTNPKTGQVVYTQVTSDSLKLEEVINRLEWLRH